MRPIVDRNSIRRQRYREDGGQRRAQSNIYRNTERGKQLRKEHARRRKHVIQAYRKKYHERNGDQIRAKVIRWYYENQERVKAYREQNKIRRNEKERARRQSDLKYRIQMNLRSRLHLVLRQQGAVKMCRAPSLLGCSFESFKIYIESKFTEGMLWGNYGDWELDHIIPCALFDLSKLEHQKRCFHFSNYQPLWQKDNQHKHTKLFHNEVGCLPL